MRRYVTYLFTLFVIGCTTQGEMNVPVTTETAAYLEPHRLQFHFSPPEMWMNDPNGMVYHHGEYHLFYQYYPDSTVWGPMHWGHAISKDLVHWEHLPIALYPDSMGYIFSGSAVVDHQNTSGLGNPDEPAIIAIYTYHDPEGHPASRRDFQTQAIAFSTDKGRTWTKYKGNPVLPNPGIQDYRDPKVIWHQETERWIMALAVKDHIRFYSSPNLTDWKEESRFGETTGAHGGVWECPDLFPLDGRWVLLVSLNPGGPNGGSATQYFVGDFDGKTFTAQDNSTRWLDYGRDNYAGVTWAGIPERDGRRIFMGWMSNWDYGQKVPTTPWRSAMTVPRVLNILPTPAGDVVTSVPARELAQLRGEPVQFIITKDGAIKTASGGIYNLEMEISNGGNEMESFELHLTNAENDTLLVGYDAVNKQLYIDRDKAGKTDFSDNFTGRQTAPFNPGRKMISLSLLVDTGSLELFVNQGELVMTSLFFTDNPLSHVTFHSSGPKLMVYGRWFKLSAIWDNYVGM
ncbi:glycoside hydrolase family 32 protein [Roseivirga sp. BDSF3-8]|uniref:glycoside hydrolase family 32 protein n=1 Tax=Roseivirga sp. BDSF3-8 TaxID=3241598 RepID=UPI0035320BD7